MRQLPSKRRVGILVALVALVAMGAGIVIYAAAPAPFFQGFEADTTDWTAYPGAVTQVASGTNGVVSRNGTYHAEVSTGGAYSRFGRVSPPFPTFPSDGFVTRIAIYLDVNAGYSNDTRFDWSVAINGPTGAFVRDFVFNAGYYNDATGPGGGTNRFVVSASNNANRANAYPKNPGRGPVAIAQSGWYVFQHYFYNRGDGVLASQLSIVSASGVTVGSWTLADPLAQDVIGTVVGAQRYGWFVMQEFPFLAVDDEELALVPAPETLVVTKNDLYAPSPCPIPTVAAPIPLPCIIAAQTDSRWFLYNDLGVVDGGVDGPEGIDNTLGSFVVGPDTTPEGLGSAQVSVDGVKRRNLATYRFHGTPLGAITTLRFSTYNPSIGNGGAADRSGYLNFNVDFNLSDTWQRRLVFTPPDNGTVIQNQWQEWDAIAGGQAKWHLSGGNWPGVSPAVSGSTNKTWSQILALYPSARIRLTDGWLGIRVGSPYTSGYTENIDAIKFGTSAGTTTFDFEFVRDTQTITFDPISSKVYLDPDFNVSASASSHLPVSFSASGQCSVSGSTVHLIGAGDCTIQADQAGDDNWAAAPPATQSFHIDRATQTIVGFGAPATATYNTTVTPITGTATSGLLVSFSGSGACNAAFLMVSGTGTCTVSASQAGDANYEPAPTLTAGVAATKATAIVALAGLEQTYTGSPLTPTATTAPSGLTIVWTGAPQTPVGSYPVTATVNDPNYQGSASGTFTIVDTAVPGDMHGDGLVTDGTTTKYHFNFQVSEDAKKKPNNRFELRVDYDPKLKHENYKFVATGINVIVFSDNAAFTPGHKPEPQVDTVVFSGTVDWKGDKATQTCPFTVNATDQGEPGKKVGEVFGVTISGAGCPSVTVHATSLSGGNIQSKRIKH